MEGRVGELARVIEGAWLMRYAHVQPTRPIMITNSNEPLPYDKDIRETQEYHTVRIYPQNISVSKIPQTPKGHEHFAETFLARKTDLQPEERKGQHHLQLEGIHSASIFICGHKARDTRCGILGPLLQTEFKKSVFDPALAREDELLTLARQDEIAFQALNRPAATVALISHIGGHAFAGNVVIYFPQTWRIMDGSGREKSPLAGKGVWYGRVEPRHVWGIVEETVKRGRVVEELLRGIHPGDDEGG